MGQPVDGLEQADAHEGGGGLVGEETDGVDVGVVQGAVALLVVEPKDADGLPLKHYRTEDEGRGTQRLDGIEGGLQQVVGGVLGDPFDEIDLTFDKGLVDDAGAGVERDGDLRPHLALVAGARREEEVLSPRIGHEHVDALVPQHLVQTFDAEGEHVVPAYRFLDAGVDLVEVLYVVVEHLVAVLEKLLLAVHLLHQLVEPLSTLVQFVDGAPDEEAEDRHDEGRPHSHVDVEGHPLRALGHLREELRGKGEVGVGKEQQAEDHPAERGGDPEEKAGKRVELAPACSGDRVIHV